MVDTTPATAPDTSRPAVPTDVRMRVGEDQFKFRVSALVFHEGALLTTSYEHADYCYLPGGKVQIGEAAVTAMHRELVEELGRDLPVGDPVLITESLYDHAGDAALRHELTFYFRLDIPPGLGPDDLTAQPEDGHAFRWVPVDQLAEAKFRPSELIGLLSELETPGRPVRHLVADLRRTP